MDVQDLQLELLCIYPLYIYPLCLYPLCLYPYIFAPYVFTPYVFTLIYLPPMYLPLMYLPLLYLPLLYLPLWYLCISPGSTIAVCIYLFRVQNCFHVGSLLDPDSTTTLAQRWPNVDGTVDPT